MAIWVISRDLSWGVAFLESGRRQFESSVTSKCLPILRTARQAITATWRQRRSYFLQRRLRSKRHF